VQIKPIAGESGEKLQIRVTEIARNIPGINAATVIDRDEARALLRPWLGDVSLPADLPIPYLVELSLSEDETGALPALGAALNEAGIIADIDDHQRWGADIRRAAKAVQITATLALILLIGATSAAAGFATQYGMSAQRIIIDVLEQVGAAPHYIARLFVMRFGRLGLMAGAAGGLGAAIMALLFWLMTGRGQSALMPSFTLDKTDVFILVLAPFFAAIICAIAAGLTALTSLKREGY
jgi:cell division transport system permease protein